MLEQLIEAQAQLAQASLLIAQARDALKDSSNAPQRESMIAVLRRCEKANKGLHNAIKRKKRRAHRAEAAVGGEGTP